MTNRRIKKIVNRWRRTRTEMPNACQVRGLSKCQERAAIAYGAVLNSLRVCVAAGDNTGIARIMAYANGRKPW